MEHQTLARVEAYLSNQPDVVAAYLFGSAAANLDHAQSDVDVALLLAESLSRSAALEIHLRVMADLEAICGRQVDVVILNTASPLVCFQVFKHGRLLAERDRKGRALFEMRARSLYYDFKPYYDLQVSQFTRRLREKGLGYGYRPHPDPSS
jgi:predicted nucleotidyltransferase